MNACAFRPKIIFGFVIDFPQRRQGDILRVTYSSGTDVVTYEYRPPFTSGVYAERDYGFERFKFYVRMVMDRGVRPSKVFSFRKTSHSLIEWRAFDARYDRE